jgi:Leucine-rich repeat (LRR) protein
LLVRKEKENLNLNIKYFRYLNNNFLSEIENLESNVELSILNLSGNRIKKIQGLGSLVKLGNLYLDKNLIETTEDLEKLLECPSISVVRNIEFFKQN